MYADSPRRRLRRSQCAREEGVEEYRDIRSLDCDLELGHVEGSELAT